MASHVNNSSNFATMDFPNSKINNFSSFTIAQFNANHCSAAMDEAFSFFINNNISILALQECYNKGGVPSGFDHSLHVIFSGSDPKVCFIVSRAVTFSLVRNLSDSHFVCVECLLDDQPFFLINCYFQPSLDPNVLSDKLDRILFSLQDRNVIVLGDFNARSSLWGDLLINERGSILSELIFKHSLSIHNEKHSGFTYSSHLGSSVIDLTLSILSNFRISDWHIDRDQLLLSDHFLILFKIISLRSSPPSSPASSPRSDSHLNFGKANWPLLSRCICSSHFERKFFSCFLMDNPVLSIKRFHILIDDIVNLCVPRGVLPRFNHWWSPALSCLKLKVRSKYKKFLRSRREADRASYRLCRNRYVSAIRTHKASWIMSNNLHELRLGRAPWGSSFKLCFDKIRSPGFPSVDRAGVTCVYDALSDMLSAAFPDDDPSSDNSSQSDLRERFNSFFLGSCRFSLNVSADEVSRAVDRLKLSKAPGLDGIRACFWKKFHFFNAKLLHYLFNFCFSAGYFPHEWKTASIIFIPKGSGSALRPISILPSIGKIFERILNDRLAAHADRVGLVDTCQFGFRPGKSTLHAIHFFRNAYFNSSSHNSILAAFLDISKAFDSAWWPDIFNILKRSGCSSLLLASIHSFFLDRAVTVTFGEASVSKRLSLGCPQGSILSPLLWNIYFNSIFDIPRHKFIHLVAYADDLAILASHYSPDLCVLLLSGFLGDVFAWSVSKKISFNFIKSVIMVLKGSPSWSPSISMGSVSSVLPVVSEFRYLGVVLSKNFHFQKHVNFAIAKGEKRALMLFKLLKTNKALTFSNMCLLYNSVIIPAFSYAISLWFETATRTLYSSRFVSLQRKCLLAISGCLRTTSTASLDLVTGVLPIHIRLESLYARETLRVSGSSDFKGYRFFITNDHIHAVDSSDSICVLSFSAFPVFIKDLALSAWNSEWTSSPNGRFTFGFFGSVSSRLNKSWLCPRGPVARFLSGHSICADYLSRFHVSSTSFCSCLSSGDLLHDLFHCVHFSHINSSFSDVNLCDLVAFPLFPLFLKFTRDRESKRLSQLNCS